MTYLFQIAFIAAIGITAYFTIRSISRIRRNIRLGKPNPKVDRKGERLRQMMLTAFGQKKMFKRPLPALLHFIVYVGFFIVNIEILEIILDGFLGTHRVFAPYLGDLYPYLINIFEFFALGVIVACVLFLIRRNILKLGRFRSKEMTHWPKLDANIILIFEIVLMSAFLMMNASDLVLQGRGAPHYFVTGDFAISSSLTGIFSGMGTDTLITVERITWWAHILGVFAFIVYIPYSKHLHILLAFPNTYYADLNPQGKFKNMPEVTAEVKMMLGIQTSETGAPLPPPERFGAKDVTDLSRKNILDAYTCTECGRCTSVCPANITGKKLSPRKIMMDTRDRAEELGLHHTKNKEEVNTNPLLGNYISEEELTACTTCNACVEACPVNINPLSIIMQMREYLIMEESKAPSEWNAMFANMENNAAPWAFPATSRFDWAQSLKKSN